MEEINSRILKTLILGFVANLDDTEQNKAVEGRWWLQTSRRLGTRRLELGSGRVLVARAHTHTHCQRGTMRRIGAEEAKGPRVSA